MNESGVLPVASRRAHAWTVAFVLAGCLATAVRLFSVVSRFASDVPFWDQWDLFDPLFGNHSWLALFREQNGPHRQGLGGLVIGVLLDTTHWNLRALAYFGALCLCAAAALALLSLWNLFPARWTDVALPLLFIAPTDAELYAGPVNPSAGPLPLLLVLIAAWGLGLRGPRRRLALLGAVGAAAIHTGFALLLAPLLLVLLLIECKRAHQKRRREDLIASGLAILAIAASGAWFAIGYQFQPALACYNFPDPQPWRYPLFAGLALLRPYAAYEHHYGVPLLVLACTLFLTAAALSFRGLMHAARRERSLVAETIFLLGGFSLLFAGFCAVGRVCQGVLFAGASRYIPFALPFVAAFYLVLRSLRLPEVWRSISGAGFAALALAANLSQHPSVAEAAMYKEWKERFADCYLARRDLAGCDRDTRALHPLVDATRLQQKLDYLDAHRLSFFRPLREGRPR